jgi:activator of HSP90 ATPase
MSTERIRVSDVFAAPSDRVYAAWIDSEQHGAMTGSKATIDPKIGGRFTAWDGYCEGRNLELVQGRKVVQSWRSTEFPDDAPDSRLEVRFEDHPDGCRVVIVHTDIPEGMGEKYESGWATSYFEPMKKHFGGPE